MIHLLEAERDAGVIEQTSLALRMIKAEDAIPTIKSRMSFNSTQTRCWLLDAIAGLGSKNDVPFIARYLYNSDTASEGIPLCATRALAALTGEDFGLPKGLSENNRVNFWVRAYSSSRHGTFLSEVGVQPFADRTP